MTENLKKLYSCFRENLAWLSQVAQDRLRQEPETKVRNKVNGSPTEKYIYSALMLCRECVASFYGTDRAFCRCEKAKDVYELVHEVCNRFARGCRRPPEAQTPPKMPEFMVDFSFSSHKLGDVYDQTKYDWKSGEKFILMLAAEAESQEGAEKTARERDLLKLCLINSPIRILIFWGTPREFESRLRSLFKNLITRCCGPDPSSGGSAGWLFVGLHGDWPTRLETFAYHWGKPGQGDPDIIPLS